jgi:hypothetical protein
MSLGLGLGLGLGVYLCMCVCMCMCVCRQRCWAQVAKEHTLSFIPRLPLLPPGDLVITLWLSTRADSLGRKRVLLVGCCLKCLAGVTFASTRHFWALAASGVIGVISTSGGEIGPFMSVEQGCGSDGRARCVGGRFSGLIANVSVPGLCVSPLVGAGEEVGGCTSFVLHSDTTPFLSLPLLHPPPQPASPTRCWQCRGDPVGRRPLGALPSCLAGTTPWDTWRRL